MPAVQGEVDSSLAASDAEDVCGVQQPLLVQASSQAQGDRMSDGLHQIAFGALSDPLRVQLSAAGVKAPPRLVRRWQKDADAITRLAVRGLIAPSVTDRARGRLAEKMADELSAFNRRKS